MCELYGFSGREKKKLNRELKEFYSHSKTNPDGWGLAVFDGAGEGTMDKKNEPAYSSGELKNLLRKPIVTKNAIAHIRWATIGYSDYDNTHPFVGKDDSGRTWTFAHNGSIFEGEVLNKYFYVQKGTTDSERIFLYLLDRMNEEIKSEGRALKPEERFDVIDSLVEELSPENKLNLLIFDGEILYVHTNEKGTLYRRWERCGYTFATTPLKEGRWEQAPFMTLTAYKNGEQVFTGHNHGHEYIMDMEKMNELFMAFSQL